MAGIYLHIPFCRTRCGYCDFYSTTDLSLTAPFARALVEELSLRRDYIGESTIDTLYFGGGTPSLLPAGELRMIMEAVRQQFTLSDKPEITIEVNPDDIESSSLALLKDLGFNRLSIGVQAWQDHHLTFLGRRHTADQADKALEASFRAGFDNISIDLIYGIPSLTEEEWDAALQKAFGSGIVHLSAYHLTIERGTPFALKAGKGLLQEIDEEQSTTQFMMLRQRAEEASFEHYEISNFARDGHYSHHNIGYWRQVPYLGAGPSAHSFNGYSRQWNSSDLDHYISELKEQRVPFTVEDIDERKRFNEYIMTSLRTMWGIDLEFIEHQFDKETHDYVVNIASSLIDYGLLRHQGRNLVITAHGMMISDNIIERFINPE